MDRRLAKRTNIKAFIMFIKASSLLLIVLWVFILANTRENRTTKTIITAKVVQACKPFFTNLPSNRDYTTREPAGVVDTISPFYLTPNFSSTLL